jgi:hypothetical protein
MGVPSPNVATSGTGAAPITADNFNSYLCAGMTLSAARAFSGVQNQEIHLIGYTSTNDGGQGIFVWTLGTGIDDGGLTTIVPTGNTAGYWARVANGSTTITPQTVSNSGGSATLTAANVSNQVLLFTGGTTPTNTFPSAAAIIGALSGMQAGAVRDLLVISENSGTTTIAPGSGVTFAGNLSTGNFAVSATSQRLFKIYIASASAVTVYG